MRAYRRTNDQFALLDGSPLVSALAVRRRRFEMEPVVAAATAGDKSAFSVLVERHRHELQAHTYRMLRSREDSEDLTQETFLRAWHRRETFRGGSFRSWLYRIATNACLTALQKPSRRLQMNRGTENVPTEPSRDRQLEAVAATDLEPAENLVARESIELMFLVAVQHLPRRQRAVLFLRDVLGWSAKDTAELLEMSVASVTSALQRARATVRERLPGQRLDWASGRKTTEDERALLRRCLEAAERADAGTFAAMLREPRPLESS